MSMSRPIAAVKTEYGRSIWRPGPRLRALGFHETDLGLEDEPMTASRAYIMNRAAAAALKRARQQGSQEIRGYLECQKQTSRQR
jgi:hypothetical protein